jgi:hypothetical protein
VLKEPTPDAIYKVYVDYRTGDMVAPKLEHREALSVEIEHFLTCVRQRQRPLSDGRLGLQVTRVLQAAQLSIKHNGRRIVLEEEA